LLNTAADQRLLILDESRLRAAAATQEARNVLIVGEPGSGKTTLLYHALGRARSENRPALLLAGRIVSGSRGLIDALLELAVEEEWIDDAVPPAADDPLGPARQLRRLRETPENALVLADDLTVEQGQTLFGALRDELWQTPVSFAVAVRPDVAQALSTPPADAFFDRRYVLEPLAGDDANLLLQSRHEGQVAGVSMIQLDRGMQPRALVALASEEGPGGRYDPTRQQELLRIAERAGGRPGAMLLAEIWGREGVSASDEHLQHSLGVTRNRLTELLRTLAEHGVLAAYPEPREGKTGRPRMIYTVTDP
jgi:energy-coupling factor transporter ATP-binding protein EcfA2